MRIAVYTCVTGGYDIFPISMAIEEKCDYYYVSDDSRVYPQGFKYIDVNMLVPDINMSPKDKNRYCKLHPHKLFPDYDYTIYIDGSIQIIKPISHNINKVGKTGLAIHRHRERDCIYSEGIFLCWLGAVKKDELIKDITRYIDAGVPRHFGLFECGMIVTDLHNSISAELYDNWYEEYMRGVKRDQQALIYTLWNMNLTVEDIGDLGEQGKYNILTNPDIKWDRGAHYK